MAGTSKTQNKYKYIELSNVKVGMKVDVYGVVKFLKPPYRSRGSDYCMMVSLTDPSYTDPEMKLKCLLFAKEENKLPKANIGDIVRFHRLAISSFKNALQGQNGPGFSWLVFSGDKSTTSVCSSSVSYTLTDTDKNKVQELRAWSSGRDELSEKLSTLNEVVTGSYFDLVAQVVSTAVIEPGVCFLLRVWDGTQCIYPVRKIPVDKDLGIQTDDLLQERCHGFLHDVSVFDDHFRAARLIMPGDFVKFVNLHAAEYKGPDIQNNPSGTATVEFVLHRGNAFGRGVTVISPQHDSLDSLKRRLENVSCDNLFDSSELTEIEIEKEQPSSSKVHKRLDKSKNAFSKQVLQKAQDVIIITSSNSESPMLNDIEETENVTKKTFKKSTIATACVKLGGIIKVLSNELVDQSHKTDITSNNDIHIDCAQRITTQTDNSERDKSEGQSGSLPRCMVQTTTVVLNHPHINRSRISDVLEHSVPYKFLVRAQVCGYHPKVESVRSFLQLYCSVCKYLCVLPDPENTENNEDSQLLIGSTFKGVPHYNCPRCYENKDSFTGLDSAPHLQYIYMMRLLLQDNTGSLLANIWLDDAETFFSLAPEELMGNAALLSQVKDCLDQICPPWVTDESKPWIECCLKSYTVNTGTAYQIFDTTVV